VTLVKYSDSQERVPAAVTKVSGLAFADAARAILHQGYAAAYLAGKKLPAQAVPAPPAATPETVTPPDEYDRYAEGYDWYGDLDDDGQDAVDDSSSGLNDRLLGLGALLLGGAVSAAMLDAWMGTYANSLNPLFEDGFQAGVNGVGEVQQATWVTEDDEACELCDPRNGMTWVGDEIDAAMPHPGEGGFGGPICMGSWRCRCSIDYEVVPADQATYSMGGYDQPEDDVEAMSTADLLKVWAITAKYELTDMPTSHLLMLRGILAKYSPDQERDDHGRWTSGGAVEEYESRVAAEELARNPNPGHGVSYGPERGIVVDERGRTIWSGTGERVHMPGEMVDTLRPGGTLTHFHPDESEQAHLSAGDVSTALQTGGSVRAFNASGAWEQFTPTGGPGNGLGIQDSDMWWRTKEIMAESPDMNTMDAFSQTIREYVGDRGTFTSGTHGATKTTETVNGMPPTKPAAKP
jgi:hypothetical protein